MKCNLNGYSTSRREWIDVILLEDPDLCGFCDNCVLWIMD